MPGMVLVGEVLPMRGCCAGAAVGTVVFTLAAGQAAVAGAVAVAGFVLGDCAMLPDDGCVMLADDVVVAAGTHALFTEAGVDVAAGVIVGVAAEVAPAAGVAPCVAVPTPGVLVGTPGDRVGAALGVVLPFCDEVLGEFVVVGMEGVVAEVPEALV